MKGVGFFGKPKESSWSSRKQRKETRTALSESKKSSPSESETSDH